MSRVVVCVPGSRRARASALPVVVVFNALSVAASKCRVKYATWENLQKVALGSGSSCDAPRFVYNGDGTATDNLTGLQWEQQTDDSTVRDKDNTLYLGFSVHDLHGVGEEGVLGRPERLEAVSLFVRSAPRPLRLCRGVSEARSLHPQER
jgi:hypothetical protein